MALRVYRRGQIWWVDLDPATGSEIRKKRPCVIVSSNAVSKLAVKLVVPLTDWNPTFANSVFHVRVEVADGEADIGGLKKCGAADVMQTRCVSESRFGDFIATMSAEKMEEIALAIAAIVEAG